MSAKNTPSWATHALTLLFGIVLGCLIIQSSDNGTELDPLQDSRKQDDPADTVEARRSGESRRKVEGVKKAETNKEASSTRSIADDNKIISAALETFAKEGIALGWASLRQDQISDDKLQIGFDNFETNVRSLPESIGKQLAEEQIEAEAWTAALKSGDAKTLLLASEKKSICPPFSLLEKDGALDKFFSSQSPEKVITLDKNPRKMASLLEDGSVLEFGPGVFDLTAFQRGLQSKKGGLADFTIKGSGMNNTLLVLNSDISPRGHVERLKISDCTIHCNNNYFFDQRRGVVTLRADRIRVIGFDMGAGGSSMMSASQSLCLFRDCRIEGGFSRVQAGYGELFDVRSSGLASRFERCVISHVEVAARSGHHVFDSCQLVEITDSKSRFESNERIRTPGSSVSYFVRVDPETRRPKIVIKDLNQLFPDWKNRIQKP